MKKIALVLLFMSSFSIHAADVDVLNNEIKNIFNGLRPVLAERISNEVNDLVSKKLLEDKDKKFQILSASVVKNNLLNYPMKFYRLDDSGVSIGTPEESPWEIVVHARVFYKGKFLKTKKKIKVRIKNLSFRFNIDWEINQDRKIIIKNSYISNQKLKISLGASNFILSGFLKFAKTIMTIKIKKAFNGALNKAMVSVEGLFKYNEGLREPTPEHLQYHVDTLPSDVLLKTVLNIEKKIRKHNLINGILIVPELDKADDTSWNEAYGPNGVGNKGKVVSVHHFGDAAIWSGTYLASQAFRYSVMKDSEALASVKNSLNGIENLLGVNGFTGLLSRAAAPINSLFGKSIKKTKHTTVSNYKGERWINYHGNRNGISRDQYSGVFFGLSLAYDHVDDPAVKKKAAYLIKIMLDYIIKNNWLVHEDRGDLTVPKRISGRTSFPTQWFMINYQRLNMLLIANHMHPGRYVKELEKYSTISESAEFFLYISSMGNHHGYYKFNLFKTNIYNYFRLEKDQKRRKELKSAYDMVNSHIGHHDNSYFNLINFTIAPDEVSTEKRKRIKTNIFRFLERRHRDISIPGEGLEDVEYITIPGRHLGDKDVKISRYPLDVRQRNSSGSFFWQKSPYSLATFPIKGSAKTEIPGIEITLIYWMGRYHKAF